MSDEHPIEQPIAQIAIGDMPDGFATYTVGRGGINRIEACSKPGEYCNIPYVRVWVGDMCAAEFCQHRIMGVYFSAPEKRS